MRDDYGLTSTEVLSLVVLFMVGDSLVLPLGVEAKEYAWVVILIATILIMPILLIYTYMMNKYPDKNFFQIIKVVFGKYIGNILIMSYIFYLMNLWALIIRNQSNFIVTLSLYRTPVYVFIIGLGLLNVMAITKGLKVICNVSKLFLVITIVFLALVSLASIPNMSYEESSSLFIDPDLGLISKGVFSLISFPFTEVILFPLIISKKKCKTIRGVLVSGAIISGLFLSVTVLSELLVLGSGMYEGSFYPIHSITRKIKIGGLLSRGEIVGMAIVVLGNVIKSSVVLQATVEGIVELFGFREGKRILNAVTLFEVAWASTITHSTMEILTMAFIYPYFELQFGLVIPVLTFITILIKNALMKKEDDEDGVEY